MNDVAYVIRGFLRQPTKQKARAYLGIEEGGSITPSVPGSGDVVGPASAVAGNFASFGDGTGKLLVDSGSSPANMPTANEKAALAGTNGAPSGANEYVTDSDPRNTNSRAPTAHATSHQNGGADEVNVGGLSGALADPQTPTAHATSHSDGGSDPVDILDLEGYTGSSSDVLRGDATWGAGGGGSDWDTTVTKSADQTVSNNATPQNDSELSVAVTTNTLYLVELLLLYAGNNTTGDYRGRFTFPDVTGGGTAMGWFNGFNAALTAVMTPVQAASTTAWPNGDMILGTTASSADFLACQVRFLLRTTGTSGTLQYQFSNSAAALGRDSITKAGSTLRIKAFTP